MTINQLETIINLGGQYLDSERFEKYLKIALEEEPTPVNLTQKKGQPNDLF